MTKDSSQPAFWDTRYRDHAMPWDSGGVPADLRAFADTLPEKARVLIPGCGSGYEALYLAERKLDVLAIDFSPAAVEIAQKNLGPSAARVLLADFFAFDAGPKPIDVVYERAFLCALPRKLWTRYAERMVELLRPGTLLAGFFLYGDNPRGPPFGTTATELHGLLDGAFDLNEDRPASESLSVFQGGERWQIWRRRGQSDAESWTCGAGAASCRMGNSGSIDPGTTGASVSIRRSVVWQRSCRPQTMNFPWQLTLRGRRARLVESAELVARQGWKSGPSRIL